MTMLTEITKIYMNTIGCCNKCGNKVLTDESYYIKSKPLVVVGCTICGNRWYPNDKIIQELIDFWSEYNDK